MKITAFVKRRSAIDRLWREHQRLGGIIEGVRFTLDGSTAAGCYTAVDQLTAAQFSALTLNPSVQVEMVGPSIGHVKVVEDPDLPRDQAKLVAGDQVMIDNIDTAADMTEAPAPESKGEHYMTSPPLPVEPRRRGRKPKAE